MRFKLKHLDLMKKMGYNWNEKECTRFLEQGGAKPKQSSKVYKQTLDCTLPKQRSIKIKMSNSLNRRLRGKTIKIFGPPGTGKTENF